MKTLGLVALLAGCSFQANGQSGPPDGRSSSGSDAPGTGSDAGGAPIDARVCFGTGLVKVCLKSAPTQGVTLPGTANPLDTGVDANCQQIVLQTGGQDLCVIAGTTVTISGSLVAIGTRPLVLIGTDAVTVAAGGTIDVSSTVAGPRKGAGASPATCSMGGVNGRNDTGGGGGGAGGSFGTAGGKGGTGDQNNSGTPINGNAPGGMASAAQATPATLRGGCSGGKGGDSDPQHRGGAGGDGGGAVYLIAGNTITIAGDVFASGAGGGATPTSAGIEQGGGGGGAGGMIGLDAPTISVPGHVVANGGAGGGGGGLDEGGMPGGDGTTTAWNTRATAGAGADAGAGPGAQGTAIGATMNFDGSNGIGGAGGGAGGLGLVWTYGTLQGTPMISPAPVTH